MTPTQLKSAQVLVTTVATSLEAAQLLPPGVCTAIGTVLSFVLGLVHPVPTKD